MPPIRVQTLYHAPFEGLGAVKTWLLARSCQIAECRLYAGQALPMPESFDWLIVMGGPMSVHDETDCPWLKPEKAFIAACMAAGKPVLGFCLGAQLIAHVRGAAVLPNMHKEIGWFPVHADCVRQGNQGKIADDRGAVSALKAPEAWLLRHLPDTLTSFHWHGETFALPENAVRLFSSAACANQGFILGDRIVGLQFHPEMEGEGIRSLIAHCAEDMKPGPFVQSVDALEGRSEYFEANRFFLEEMLSGLWRRAGIPTSP